MSHEPLLSTNSLLENRPTDSLDASLDALQIKRTSSAQIKANNVIDLTTPNVSTKGSTKPNELHGINYDDETPYKEFPMPSTTALRRLPLSQHRTLLSSASQTKKCRSEIEKEFKSQKVLFTTPSAVSRPAIKLMSNLTLDDSLHCYKSSPIINLPPVSEEKISAVKSASQEIKENESLQPTDKTDGSIDNKMQESVDKKQKILRINGKDFIVRERIGSGGSSTVHLAEHKETKLECAIKVKLQNSFIILFDI